MTSSRWSPERLDPERYACGVELPVFYGDLDTQGHLNNVAFGRFFEQARFVSHRSIGLPALNAEEGAHFVVARVSIDYLQEARFGSPLQVRTRVVEIKNKSVVEQQAAWQKGGCVALAEVIMVSVRDGRTTPVSPRMRTAFEQLQVTLPAT
jgi:acyl-CoA thioester hydrolase